MSAAPIFVAGEWRRGGGPDLVSWDPADGSEVGVVASASVDDVDAAVQAGAEAMRRADWRDLLAHERAGLLRTIGSGIRDRAEDLAQLQSRDNGKPITDCRALVLSAAGTFNYVASVVETAQDDLTPARGEYLSMSVHEPIGVVGAITPWNSPIASDAQKVAPALAAGCAVILKPAELTPLVALELARICDAAGVPPGILSVLPGPGRVIGDAIVRHPLVRKVSFTGGTQTGIHIARVAAEKLTPVSLELGGKSPTVVFDDADLDHAVAGVAFGIFASSGQACVAGSRLFVHERIADEFLERLTKVAQGLRIGNPRDDATQMGPLISAEHREHVEAYVATARAEGGDVLFGGERPADPALAAGHYLTPSIICGLPPTARAVQEEIFGPVLAVMRFQDDDELIAAANDSVYGLACGLWTSDYRRAWRVARRIEAGTVWINTYKVLSIATPFGGVKSSGIGREKGRDCIRQYQSQKGVYWGLHDDPLPWIE